MGCKYETTDTIPKATNSWALTMWDVNLIEFAKYTFYARSWALTMWDVNWQESLICVNFLQVEH